MAENLEFEFLCRMGDNALVLGHRLSEWCGHAPVLEEDIAIANVALDLIGQATNWLARAAEVEGAGRGADDLAMLRDAWDFRNVLLVEQPNGDFGQTIMRQMLFDRYHLLLLEALRDSGNAAVAEIAAKSVREVTYHAERSSDLVIRLGDGTEKSHARMQSALELFHPYIGEMLESDDVDLALAEAGTAPRPETLAARYDAAVDEVLDRAMLTRPTHGFVQKGGKSGFMHSEHLGHMLATMQTLQRSFPGAMW
ncbi:MAG: 1,2-phenylacetyl-CoA epoxidase subunit PaaC [Pseudomonadota bacterium]